MKTIKYFLTFLFFNFLALAVGVLLMKDGPQTKWYLSLNKASVKFEEYDKQKAGAI